MSGPRNRPAWERAQRARAAIREHLLEHARLHPFSQRPTWRELRAHLREHGIDLGRSAICWHVQQIEQIDRSASNSSMIETAA